MEQFILQLGTMSLQACLVIGVVFLVRLIFSKAGVSKKYTSMLWFLPYLCMVCPWKIESTVGFWRQPESYSQGSFQEMFAQIKDFFSGQSAVSGHVTDTVGQLQAGIESVISTEQAAAVVDGILIGSNANQAANVGNIAAGEALSELAQNTLNASANYGAGSDIVHILLTVAGIVWIVGLVALVIYSADAHLKLHTKLICCMKLSDNIYYADDIAVPFVLGVWKPRIYLPTGMSVESLEYVIAHEKTHIRRRDPLKKMIAFGITCLHWFNPLVWVAFHFFGKDMEMACDEETILKLGLEHRQEYATVLLNLSSGRKMFLGAPLAFGEGSVKEIWLM